MSGGWTPTSCAGCIWWSRKKPRDLWAEFNADPRPEPKTIWQWLKWTWNPSAWKEKPDFIDLDFVHDPAPMVGWCKRFPKELLTRENYACGEFVARIEGESA